MSFYQFALNTVHSAYNAAWTAVHITYKSASYIAPVVGNLVASAASTAYKAAAYALPIASGLAQNIAYTSYKSVMSDYKNNQISPTSAAIAVVAVATPYMLFSHGGRAANLTTSQPCGMSQRLKEKVYHLVTECYLIEKCDFGKTLNQQMYNNEPNLTDNYFYLQSINNYFSLGISLDLASKEVIELDMLLKEVKAKVNNAFNTLNSKVKVATIAGQTYGSPYAPKNDQKYQGHTFPIEENLESINSVSSEVIAANIYKKLNDDNISIADAQSSIFRAASIMEETKEEYHRVKNATSLIRHIRDTPWSST